MNRTAPSPRWPTRRRALALITSSVATALAFPVDDAARAGVAPAGPTRGFNLPGWVDREGGTAPSGAVLAKLHRLGFRTVRLPVNADLIAAADRETSTDMLRQIHDAVSRLISASFAVIVDMHPSGRLGVMLGNDPGAGGDFVAAAWARLADVVAQLPEKAVYAELLNEPPLERSEWLALRGRLAGIVRTKCPRHTLIWGPSRYQGIWELAGTPPLDDDNQIASVHYYTPMGFTHQCENWDRSPLTRIRNLPFPATEKTPAVAALMEKFRVTGDEEALAFLHKEFTAPWTAKHVAADFASAADWSRSHGCRVILDEFGVLDFCVDPVSRASWVRAVREAAEANGIGWTYWEVDRGFGFVHDRRSTEGFDRTMIDALIGP